MAEEAGVGFGDVAVAARPKRFGHGGGAGPDLGIEHIAVVCFPPHASLGAEQKLQQRRVGDIVGRAVRRGVDVVVFGPVRVVLIAV